MIDDIIIALKSYYKEDREMLVDCLMRLSPLDGIACADEIRGLGYCPECGEKLQNFTWKEYHPEIDSPPYFEQMCELMCPNCDFR